MEEDIDEMGPIDYLVVEFPGSRMTGEAFPLLVDLVDRGIIRILDLVFVRKEPDGSVVRHGDRRLRRRRRARPRRVRRRSSGLLGDDDIDEAGGVLEPGSSAGDPRLRERLGGAVRRRAAARRRPAGRQRPDPRPGDPRRPRRRRAGQPDRPSRTKRKQHHARTAPRRRPYRRRRGDRDRRIQPGLAPPGRPLGRSRSSSSTAAAVRRRRSRSTHRRPRRPRRTTWRQARPAQGARRAKERACSPTPSSRCRRTASSPADGGAQLAARHILCRAGHISLPGQGDAEPLVRVDEVVVVVVPEGSNPRTEWILPVKWLVDEV